MPLLVLRHGKQGVRPYHTMSWYGMVWYGMDTIPYHTITYLTIPYHNIPYHTIPYHVIPYHTMPYHTIPYLTIPYHTIPYHTMSYHTLPYHTPIHIHILCRYASLCAEPISSPANLGPSLIPHGDALENGIGTKAAKGTQHSTARKAQQKAFKEGQARRLTPMVRYVSTIPVHVHATWYGMVWYLTVG